MCVGENKGNVRRDERKRKRREARDDPFASDAYKQNRSLFLLHHLLGSVRNSRSVSSLISLGRFYFIFFSAMRV